MSEETVLSCYDLVGFLSHLFLNTSSCTGPQTSTKPSGQPSVTCNKSPISDCDSPYIDSTSLNESSSAATHEK